MQMLKDKLTKYPVLILFQYSFPEVVNTIILFVNSNLEEWESILNQKLNKKQTIIKYENRLWNKAKRNYDITKRKY